MHDRDRTWIAWVVCLVLLAMGLWAGGAEQAFHFSVAPIDGVLQLFNPLRRIAAGQRGGVDFQVFHGLGLPYAFYPLFRLFGGTMTGTELARQLAAPTAAIMTYLLTFAALTRSWRRGVALTVIALLATIALKLTSILFPGHNLLAVRGAMPLFFVAALAWTYDATPWRRRLLLGALMGLSLLLGTEHGMAVVAGYVTVTAARAIRSTRRRDVLVDAATTVALGIATFVLGLLLIGGPSGARNALRYNLGDISRDQFWYFGAPPNGFLYRFGQLFTEPFLLITLSLGTLNAGWWLWTLLRRDAEQTAEDVALAVLAVYGLISAASLLGLWLYMNAHALARVLVITGLVLANRAAARQHGSARARHWTPVAAVAVLACAIVVEPLAFRGFLIAPVAVLRSHIIGRRPAELSPEWRSFLQVGQRALDERRARTGRAPTLWSTYAGELEARNGIFHPSFDYVIHALGPENRAAYLARFRETRPDIVQTIDPRYTPYEEWLEATTWDLYRELMLDYRVVGGSPYSLFWERLAARAAEPALVQQIDIAPEHGRDPVVFHGIPSGRGIYEAEATYRLTNPWKRFPIVGHLPRFLLHFSGTGNRIPVPLAPYYTVARFPVVMRGDTTFSIVPVTRSLLPGPRLELTSVKLTRLPLTADNIPWYAAFIGETSNTLGRTTP